MITIDFDCVYDSIAAPALPTSMCFSPDARWLVVAAMDAIRVYDVPSGTMIGKKTTFFFFLFVFVVIQTEFILYFTHFHHIHIYQRIFININLLAYYVDWFRTQRAVTSIDFSPFGDFIATTHVGKRGVYLWANQNVYFFVYNWFYLIKIFRLFFNW